MPGSLNIGGSVFKRETASIDEVEQKLVKDGWDKTGTAGGGKVRYYQKSGINITTISGPMGTIVMPSGPLRGRLFGDQAVGISQMSLMGMGASADDDENPRTKRFTDQIT